MQRPWCEESSEQLIALIALQLKAHRNAKAFPKESTLSCDREVGQMYTGRMKSKKGAFGRVLAFGSEILVHRLDCPDGRFPEIDQRVRFRLGLSKRKIWKALCVEVMDEEM